MYKKNVTFVEKEKRNGSGRGGEGVKNKPVKRDED